MASCDCSVSDCAAPKLARGLCRQHYRMWQKHGDPEWMPPPISCTGCRTTFVPSHWRQAFCTESCRNATTNARRFQGAPLCSVSGCRKTSRERSLCAAHYARLRRHGDPLVSGPQRKCARCALPFTASSGTQKSCPSCAETRLARKLGNGRYAISESDKRRSMHRNGNRCAYCKQKLVATHWDHVVPLARGGADSLGNLVPSCPSCNHSKHAKTIMEWRVWLVRRGLPDIQSLTVL